MGSNSSSVRFHSSACSRERSNLSFLVDVVASVRKRNTTASTSPTGLRMRHQSADTHISTPRHFRPRSLTESSAYATTSHLFLGSTDSLRETLTSSMDAASCAPLYRVGNKSPRTVASKYRKKRMAPPPPLSPPLVPAVLDVRHSTTPHFTSAFAMNSGNTSREHPSPSALRIRKKPSSSWSTSELSPRSVYFSSRPVSDFVGRSKSFAQKIPSARHYSSRPHRKSYTAILRASSVLPIQTHMTHFPNVLQVCCSDLPSLVEYARGLNVEENSSESLPVPYTSAESSIHENSVQSSAMQPSSKTNKPAVAPRPSAELLAKHVAHRHTLNLWVPTAVSPIDMHHSAEFTDELKRVTSRFLESR
ncbi:hypothetical protein PHET_04975 [Paragonimus heterotremus]|uniref:Uncharacterized protein n=1 Tax=Paragonimus heterotremus TaxID=100268 RepID=A0A8J4TLT6_9TREM|nr:hypothetical protein PHET_04975 [Paragonimus heterotremus]